VERFDGTMRDETLNGEEFHSVLEARRSPGVGRGVQCPPTPPWTRDENPRQFADDCKKSTA